MPKRGKAYRNNVENFDKSKLYAVEEGVKAALDSLYTACAGGTLLRILRLVC